MRLTEEQQAAAFNEWMRWYTENPEEFHSEYTEIKQFLTEKNNGETPSYGAECVGILNRCHARLIKAAAP
jgi:hypothetical protein